MRKIAYNQHFQIYYVKNDKRIEALIAIFWRYIDNLWLYLCVLDFKNKNKQLIWILQMQN